MCNRSHISARGSTKYEVKKASKKKGNAFEETDENDLIESTITTEIGELIDFIQLEAKKYRTGIRYTELHMNAINFKRPKIWSTTRMCLYEFEMTLRFLENKVYFEIPRDKVILCQMYCMVMFGLKIILKQCQKTDVTDAYVGKVIVGDYGEKIMKYCLNVGYNLLKYGTSTTEDEHPDILAEFPSLVQAEKNKFIIELQDFVTEKKALFLLEEDGSVRPTRNTVSVEGVIDSMYQVVENYISKFWKEMNERIQLTDLSAGPTSFSEAPAESVFSVWSRILTGREALTVGNTIALVRVSMEGPEA